MSRMRYPVRWVGGKNLAQEEPNGKRRPTFKDEVEEAGSLEETKKEQTEKRRIRRMYLSPKSR